MVFLTSYVPYDASLWHAWWKSIMLTIGSASAVGFIVFTALTVITIFKIVIRFWSN